MLDLHNILWAIPGVIFIYLYNRNKPNETISLSGWPYLFFLVTIGALTWLPAELIVRTELVSEFISRPELISLMVLGIAIFLSFTWLFVAQFEPIANWIFVQAFDNFYKKCMEWEYEEILLTLKNGKAYIGILWRYSENPKERYESQVISIAPLMSGYRCEQTKKIIWNTKYPEYMNESDLSNMEILIPRSGLVTFGKFNRRVFDYFYPSENS